MDKITIGFHTQSNFSLCKRKKMITIIFQACYMPQIMKNKQEIQQARTIYWQDTVRVWKTSYDTEKTLTGKHVLKAVYK